jgi:hypothetical protein
MKTYKNVKPKKKQKNKKKTRKPNNKGRGVKKTQLKTNEPRNLFTIDQFTDFDSVISHETKRIGNGNNGIIWSIPFRVTYNYTSYAVLKCNALTDKDGGINTNDDNYADNLYYEYFVGKHFINKYVKKFPCFVETYDCYTLSPDKWNDLMTKTSNIELNTGIRKYSGDFSTSCTNSIYLSVLIQHFDSNQFYSLYNEIDNMMVEIPFICYQILFVLCSLGDSYTHYDLHLNNVFCYKPYDDKRYIRMNYHKKDGSIISFPTQYIMKIIDYGRNYFNNGTKNTNDILQTEICNNPKCQPECGLNFGYSIIQGHVLGENEYKTTPDKPNSSNDLKFMRDIIMTYLHNRYGILFTYDGDQYENGYPHRIQTIYDAQKVMEDIIRKDPTILMRLKYDEYFDWEQAAEMNIYEDGRDFEYINLL